MEEKRREEWMAILRQSRLCRNLEEKELLNLMEQEGTVRTYSRGERIFQETCNINLISGIKRDGKIM